MGERKNTGAEEKSELDSVEEALVGSHQGEPGAEADSEGEPKPDVPGHRSP